MDTHTKVDYTICGTRGSSDIAKDRRRSRPVTRPDSDEQEDLAFYALYDDHMGLEEKERERMNSFRFPSHPSPSLFTANVNVGRMKSDNDPWRDILDPLLVPELDGHDHDTLGKTGGLGGSQNGIDVGIYGRTISGMSTSGRYVLDLETMAMQNIGGDDLK